MPRTVDQLQTEMILAHIAKKRKSVTPDLQKYYEARFDTIATGNFLMFF
jgi:hypothetical protein